jgi:hypothetical protein
MRMKLAKVNQLGLAMLGNGAAKVVVAGNGVDLDALVGGQLAELLAARLRHVERIAVGALAVNLDALVPELPGTADDLLDSKGIASVPDAAIGDAIQADLDMGVRHRCRREDARG